MTTPKRRSNLRFETLNRFIDSTIHELHLTPCEALVWMVVYRDSKPPKWLASASFDDIARRANISRRSVANAVRSLTSKKLLHVVRRGGLNRGSTVYVATPIPVEPD